MFFLISSWKYNIVITYDMPIRRKKKKKKQYYLLGKKKKKQKKPQKNLLRVNIFCCKKNVVKRIKNLTLSNDKTNSSHNANLWK